MQTPRSGRSAGARRHRRGALFDRRDYPGLEATLEEMARLTHEYLSEPEVREAALEATRGVSNMRSVQAIAEAVHEWVRANVKYTRDPVGIEFLQSPDVLVRQIENRGRKPAADCDGMAVLAAALLGNVGVEPGFRAIAQREAGEYDHVYVIYQDAGTWKTLDPTIERRPGIDPYDPLSTKEIRLKTMDDLAQARRPTGTTTTGYPARSGTPGITSQRQGNFNWPTFLSNLINTVPDTVRAFRGKPPQRTFPVQRRPGGQGTGTVLPQQRAGISMGDVIFYGSLLAGGGLTVYLLTSD